MEDLLKKAILDVPDFPKKGIIFKDLTPVFRDPKVFGKLIDFLAKRYKGKKINRIACVESRGFIIGAPLAVKMGVSFIPVRKPGKLPRPVYRQEYALEYGTDKLEILKDAAGPGDNVLILDDLLATGGTASAAAALVEQTGAKVAEIAFMVELDFLKGREKLSKYPVFSIVHY